MPVGYGAVGPDEQREPVTEAPGDLGDRHHPDLRGGQLDREREPVEADDQGLDLLVVEAYAGTGGTRPTYEQLVGILDPELGQQVDLLGGDPDRCP